MVKTFIPVCLSFMGFLVFPKAQEHINSSEELCLCKYHGIGRRRESTWASNNIRNLYNPLVCQKALPDEVFITKPSFYLRCFYSRYLPWKRIHFVLFDFRKMFSAPKREKLLSQSGANRLHERTYCMLCNYFLPLRFLHNIITHTETFGSRINCYQSQTNMECIQCI